MKVFKNKFFRLLLALALFGSGKAAMAEVVADNACFVISGTAHDGNGALNRLRQAEMAGMKYSFSGYQCSIFNSYQQLKEFLAHSDIPKGSPILILQVTHGGVSGSAAVNAMPGTAVYAPESLIQIYNAIAKNYKVALVNQSCYSGDLMEQLIAWESHHVSAPAVDNLCLATDSLPGRVAFGIDQYDRSKFHAPYTLEDAYLQKPLGMISSAAWSQVGLTQYTEPRLQLPTYPLFKVQHPEMISRLEPAAQSLTDAVGEMLNHDSSTLLPAVQKEVELAKMIFMSSASSSKMSIYGQVKKAVELNLNQYTQIRMSFFAPLQTGDACAAALQPFLSAQWYRSFAQDHAPWAAFTQTLATALTAGPLQACTDAPTNGSTSSLADWLAVRSPVGTYMKPFAKAQENFEREFGVSTMDYDGALQMQAAQPTANTDANRLAAMKSAIGLEMGPQEYQVEVIHAGLSETVGVPTLGTVGGTGNILPAFSAMSLIQPEMTNPLDARRRAACRSIQLKSN